MSREVFSPAVTSLFSLPFTEYVNEYKFGTFCHVMNVRSSEVSNVTPAKGNVTSLSAEIS